MSMHFPERIIDLHTHLFNARYVPLANIIANAMGKEESALANRVAALLEAITGSSYEPAALIAKAIGHEDDDDILLEKIWGIARFELMSEGESIKRAGNQPNQDLFSLIVELSEVDVRAEGWMGQPLPQLSTSRSLVEAMNAGDRLGWAERVVKSALRIVVTLMEPATWGHAHNYLEFFLTMLKSERDMVARLFAGYGKQLPPLQVVHYLMDMEKAYTHPKPPRYAFFPEQLNRMKALQSENAGKVLGFSAFDPRRGDWRKYAESALEMGFLGFKFYPAMGYKPFGDETWAERIGEFFDFCIKCDVPVFVHCTPVGFQTIKKQGWFAHPQHWADVLADARWRDLRLCFGHAGGGESSNGDKKSFGWMAKTDSEWEDKDNFARIVAELCVSKPNVYCELGYITEVLEPELAPIFLSNLKRASALAGPCQFLKKVAYGSDWHMPDMVDDVRQYLEFFLELMSTAPYSEYREDFFWRTASAYLNQKSWQSP